VDAALILIPQEWKGFYGERRSGLPAEQLQAAG
ncbi:MAG: hypothetical protein ACI9MR_004700, partial [Myxococcota bacterium]